MKYSGFRRDLKRHVLTFSTSGQRQVTTCCACAVTSRKKCHVSGCRRQAPDVCCLRCLIDGSKPTNEWWKTLHVSESQSHLRLNWPTTFNGPEHHYGGPSLSLHFTTCKLKCMWYFAFKWNFISSLSLDFKLILNRNWIFISFVILNVFAKSY